MENVIQIWLDHLKVSIKVLDTAMEVFSVGAVDHKWMLYGEKK